MDFLRVDCLVEEATLLCAVISTRWIFYKNLSLFLFLWGLLSSNRIRFTPTAFFDKQKWPLTLFVKGLLLFISLVGYATTSGVALDFKFTVVF